jgi:hypothetical protein
MSDVPDRVREQARPGRPDGRRGPRRERVAVEGVGTEEHPPDGEDTFGWLVIDGEYACHFAEYEALPARAGEKVRLRAGCCAAR